MKVRQFYSTGSLGQNDNFFNVQFLDEWKKFHWRNHIEYCRSSDKCCVFVFYEIRCQCSSRMLSAQRYLFVKNHGMILHHHNHQNKKNHHHHLAGRCDSNSRKPNKNVYVQKLSGSHTKFQCQCHYFNSKLEYYGIYFLNVQFYQCQ